MKRLMGAFLAVSAIAAIEIFTGVPATPAQACVIANFKNPANSCPAGTTYGRGNVDNAIVEPASAPPEDAVTEPASAPPEDVVAEPASTPPEALGCVKTNVKSFKNACSN